MRNLIGLSFYRAAKGDQIEMAKLILNSKFKTEIIELEDKYGRNVFHYAAAVNKSQVLKYLITWTMVLPFYLSVQI